MITDCDVSATALGNVLLTLEDSEDLDGRYELTRKEAVKLQKELQEAIAALPKEDLDITWKQVGRKSGDTGFFRPWTCFVSGKPVALLSFDLEAWSVRNLDWDNFPIKPLAPRGDLHVIMHDVHKALEEID